MNIDPPNAWEWILLLLVGALAGGVNALRSYAQKGTTQALVVGALDTAGEYEAEIEIDFDGSSQTIYDVMPMSIRPQFACRKDIG
ncbi:MAG: hypothetical protein B7X50_12370 [Alishewanella sp. 34-51-39]|nr:MAG: hypothetical protein B7X50_12370 [Alishewanella sp. 34-51-39]